LAWLCGLDGWSVLINKPMIGLAVPPSGQALIIEGVHKYVIET